jgi:chemotaxis protein MotB
MRAKGQTRGNSKAGGIIVRKEEAAPQASHGGAWKVAYADFVTAMMAFFLLMWLINATTEAQRKGLADYFAPSNAFSFRYSGSGKPFGGRTPFSPGQMVSDSGAVQVITGTAEPVPNGRPDPSTRRPGTLPPGRAAVRPDRATHAAAPAQHAARAVRGSLPPAGGAGGPDVGAPALPIAAAAGGAAAGGREQAAFQHAARQIRAAIQGDPELAGLAKQLAIDITPQGLRIQILDGRRQPVFAIGSAELAPPARLFVARLAPILARLSGPIAISGYTDAAPYHGTGMSNWDLSTERANRARSLLVASGLPGARIARVSGYADRDLLLPADPLAAENRRMAIVVLRTNGVSPTPRAPDRASVPAR